MVYECEAVVSKALRHGDLTGLHLSESFHVPVHEEIVVKSAVKSAENAPSVSETHVSNMDLDDLDDIPLARLLKKSYASEVALAKPTDPIISAHSQKSSSSEDVFVPTPGLHHASNVERGPSQHSPSVR